MSPDEARRAALVKFGAVEAVKAEYRDRSRVRVLDGMVSDVRHAVRRLRAAPAFTLFAFVSLALGIGATTAIYSTVHTLLWRPAGIAEPEDVVNLVRAGAPAAARSTMSRPDFRDFSSQQTSFSGLAASEPFQAAIAGGRLVETLHGEAVNGAYFRTLGIEPRLGRLIQPADERPGAPPVVVLSERLWRSSFAGDPRTVGTVVTIAGVRFEVIGVAPSSFLGLVPYLPTGAWVTLDASPAVATAAKYGVDVRSRHRLTVSLKGRLAAGRTIEQATAEVALVGQRLDAEYPRPSSAGTKNGRFWRLTPHAEAAGDDRVSLIGQLIVAATAILLLIACTNLASLSLARGSSRRQELDMRRALGASRWRLVREQLAESALLVGGGAVGSVVVIRFLLHVFTTDVPFTRDIWVRLEPEVSAAALAIAGASVLLSLLVFGVGPALHATRADLQGVAASGGDATLRWRKQRSVVAWQVAGSAALFLVAAVLLRILVANTQHDSGVDVGRLAVAQLDFALNGREEADARRTIEAVLALASRTPGIQAVAASAGLPFGVPPSADWVTQPDRPFEPYRHAGEDVYTVLATPHIFRTLGVRLVAGRTFSDEPEAGVVVVSERVARALFQRSDVVGRELLFSRTGSRPSQTSRAETLRIIGVSADTDAWMMGRRSSGVIYRPLTDHYRSDIALVARASRDPSAAAATLRGIVRRVDPGLAVSAAGSGWVMLAGPFVMLGAVAALASGLGTLALVLAMVGLYGVLSYVVARRTREMAVRMALGAEPKRIVRMVMRDGVRPVLEGLVLALVVAVGIRLVFRAILDPSIPVIDLLVFGLAPLPLLAAALLASYLPARRAARVDPNVALRDL
jgi:predicted permease